ncbi:hypothetical protein BCR35DRAFT_303656 [Leucosporidium creatinivorum]|uniref:Uncharacterized protein n=1 Tax=Leucosporidium creatinivorum TaxID=106004 RepID=A0A1Y2FGD1_9BASI|nr:hypothetical protein BCR35DRAFT_303656 [Leucosporidium creatinivorum]
MSAASSMAQRRSSRTRPPPVTSASSPTPPTPPAAPASSRKQRPAESLPFRRFNASSSSSSIQATTSPSQQGKDTAARRKRSREVEETTTHEQMDEDLPAERDPKRAGLQPYSTTASTSKAARFTTASPETSTPTRPAPSLLTPSAPSTPLPSLLSHLSLSPSFPASPTPVSAQGTFSFPTPPPAIRHPTYPQHPLSSRPPHPFYYRGYIRPPHEMDLTDKRPSEGPHPHLLSRTKKRKLVHRFFRCEAILSGPPTPSSSSPLSSPTTSPPSKPRARPIYSPTQPRRPPAWWPSVSRNAGDGMASRMGPAEAEWVGDGSGWLSRLRLNFTAGGGGAAAKLEQALKADQAKGKGREVEGTSEQLGALLGASAIGGRPMLAMAPAMGRTVSKRSRSASSPPAFNRGKSAPEVGGGPWAPPPLKQHLLAVLRMRLSEGGGTSKGGEAGLKFKKWVVWNSWMRRTSGLNEDEDEDDLVEGNGSDSDEDMDGDIDFVLSQDEDDDDLLLALDGDEDELYDGTEPSPRWQGSTLFNGPVDILPPIRTSPETSSYTHDPSPTAMEQDASSSSPSSSSASTAPSSLPSPTPVPGLISPYRAPRALPDLPPLKLHEDLSHALGVSSLAVGLTRGARVADAVSRGLPVAEVGVVGVQRVASRPMLRRSTSLPTSVGEMTLQETGESSEEQERQRGRERERESGQRRVGSISPIACEA